MNDSIYMTLWKSHNDKYGKQISGFQEQDGLDNKATAR